MRYSWETPYVLAILQTDEASRHKAVYEAIEAREQRRIIPVNGMENVALMSAEGWSANADRGNDREVAEAIHIERCV